MRLKRLEGILAFAFASLVLGLVYLQLIHGEAYRKQSEENIIRLIPIPAPRGEITDRNGVVLAEHRQTFDVAVLPQETRNLAKLVAKLSTLTGVPADTLFQAYARGVAAPFVPVSLIEDIGKEEAILLAERRDLPGLTVLVTPRRHYPYGKDTAHLLGVLGEIPPKELSRLRPYGYKMKDLLGQGGIEEAFDNYLRGKDGGTQFKVDSKGYKVETLGYRPAEKGKPVGLTVDIRLQRFIQDLFEGKQGASCVMDPRTGEILALVSSPTFDPNEDFSARLRERSRPFLNRVIQGRYPPGSTFKIVVAAMALEEGKLTPQDTFFCPGALVLGDAAFKCWWERGHKEETLLDAIRHSCNVFFYRTGLAGGPEAIAAYARRFGFGKPSGIELPYEASGFVPHPAWKRRTYGERWYDGDTANFAIGQGYLTVTPIQLLRMASVIATDGSLVTPHLVNRIADVQVKGARRRELPLSKETLSVIRKGMVSVVHAPDGTGRYAAVEGLEIAGKTGTAQVQGEDSHAWFVGFSPHRGARLSLVVLVEHGGKGGLAASEMAAAIFKKAKELELL